MDLSTARRALFGALLVAALILSVAEATSITSWSQFRNVNLPVSTRLASVVSGGRFTFYIGGFDTVEPQEKHVLGGTTHLAYLDTKTGRTGKPFRLSQGLDHEGNRTTRIVSGAALDHPVAGLNAATTLGSDLYVIRACSMIPFNYSFDENTTSLTEFETVQRIRLLRPPHNITEAKEHYVAPTDYDLDSPLVDITTTVLTHTSMTPRANASCVAAGGLIYVVGGVLLPSMEYSDQGFAYDPTTGSVSLVFTAEVQVGNTATAADSETLYLLGGLMAHQKRVEALGFFYRPTSHYDFPLGGYPALLENSDPQLVVINGSLFVTGGNYKNVIAHDLWVQNAAWPPIQDDHEIGVRESAFMATVDGGNTSFFLLGGYIEPATTVPQIYTCQLKLPNAIPVVKGLWFPDNQSSIPKPTVTPSPLTRPPPMLTDQDQFDELSEEELFTNSSNATVLPGSNGNYTKVVGYKALWSNRSFGVLLGLPEEDVRNFGPYGVLQRCSNTSSGSLTACTFRISANSKCEAVLGIPDAHLVLGKNVKIVEVDLFDEATGESTPTKVLRVERFKLTTYNGFDPVPLVNDFPYDNNTEYFPDMSLPLLTPCLSTGTKYLTGCSNAKPCPAKFFTPLTTTDPYVWASLPEADIPTPPPSLPPLTPHSSTKTPVWTYIIIGAAAVLVFAVAIGVSLQQRWKRSEFEKVSLLGDRRAGRGGGLTEDQTKDGLLDGRYRILQRLGKGSFSVVYLVERPGDTGSRFALKYVQCEDDVDRHEAMKECEVVRKLQGHPNVIKIVDMFLSYKFDTNLNNSPTTTAKRPSEFYDDESPVSSHGANRYSEAYVREEEEEGNSEQGQRYLSLVMEYHERGDLGRFVKRSKIEERNTGRSLIPEATIVSVAYQICSVLNYMHTKNPPIIHRDLKPENLLLSSIVYDNVAPTFLPVVVTDFGLARVMDKTFCETGVGSLPYVAPECWQRHYTTKVDIWAVGCILYAVASRRVEADTVKVMFSESARAGFKESIVRDMVNFGYSEALGQFICFLLNPDPNARPSAGDALQVIKKRYQLQEEQISSSPGVVNIRKDSQFEYFIPRSGILESVCSLRPPESDTLPRLPPPDRPTGSKPSINTSVPVINVDDETRQRLAAQPEDEHDQTVLPSTAADVGNSAVELGEERSDIELTESEHGFSPAEGAEE